MWSLMLSSDMPSGVWICTHFARARYGAGIMPGIWVKTEKARSLHLNPILPCCPSPQFEQIANILPPIFQTEALPHCTTCVVLFNAAQ